jgi:hypothetical protein
LEQLRLAIGVLCAAQIRKRVPQLFHDDQQLLGVNFFVARLVRGAGKDVLQLLTMIPSAHRTLHDGAKGVHSIGLESRRRHPIVGHHEVNGRERARRSRRCLVQRAPNLIRVFGFVKLDGVWFAPIAQLTSE